MYLYNPSFQPRWMMQPPVLNSKSCLDVNLCVGVCHRRFLFRPYGTSLISYLVSTRILSLTGQYTSSLLTLCLISKKVS